MIELRNVEKSYQMGEVTVHALNDAAPEVRANLYVRSSQIDHRGPFGRPTMMWCKDDREKDRGIP